MLEIDIAVNVEIPRLGRMAAGCVAVNGHSGGIAHERRTGRSGIRAPCEPVDLGGKQVKRVYIPRCLAAEIGIIA